MSLHEHACPPPLAIAIHPAPPRSDPKKDSKPSDGKDGKKEGEKDDKKDEGKDEKPKPDENANKADKDKPKDPDDKDKIEPTPDTPITPESPSSMVPEPPTPVAGADAGAETPQSPVSPTSKQDPASPSPKNRKGKDKKNKDKNKDDKESKDKKETDKAEKTEDKPAVDSTPPIPQEPIKLLSPAPFQYIRTRLDLEPTKPYPPLEPDPRGAYHKYAYVFGEEVIFIEITKDGWLVDQWKEKNEREALAQLRGDFDKKRLLEIEAEKAKQILRPVPKTSAEILLDLWNDLTKAKGQEIPVEEFWSRYDWSHPDAQIHLEDIKRPKTAEEKEWEKKEKEKEKERAAKEKKEKEEKERKEKEEAEKGKEDKKEEEAVDKESKLEEKNAKEESKAVVPEEKETSQPEETAETKKEEPDSADANEGEEAMPKVEWTRSGLEDILATVGVSCTYNTEKPIPDPTRFQMYPDPLGGYMILGHGFFMLRIREYLSWKPQESANKFEVLVTSGRDRVFGDMVKQQQMEERKKKELEYRKKKAAEKKNAEKDKKEGEGDDGKKEKDGKGDNKDGKADETPKDKAGDGVDKSPDSPASNVKLRDGEEVKPEVKDEAADKNDKDKPAMIAVPVADDHASPKNKDEMHDADPVAVAVKAVPEEEVKGKEEGEKKDEPKDGKKEGDDKAGKGEGDKDKEKDKDKDKKDPKKRPFDPMREAEKLAKMMAGDGPVNMEDIQMAFKALEMAGGMGGGGEKKREEEHKGPFVWVWRDSVEKWRWKNYEAGVNDIRPGGWEERDWKVFADDRGCDQFEEDESWEENLQIDLHGWSC